MLQIKFVGRFIDLSCRVYITVMRDWKKVGGRGGGGLGMDLCSQSVVIIAYKIDQARAFCQKSPFTSLTTQHLSSELI